ncbi:glycoside hydrolase family 3 N-terminal domain-containing protein [Arenibacterium sp. LLYu02]|uniref:glycoside hydrolase family 3 N-terminal domain-containing protein n=1 Tax=Arenibacterium sp. LLYu02 TaxID=3404132 RepID=UPI003B220593
MRFGATILDATGLRLTEDEKALFREAAPFGFILFARNIESADQVRALCDDFREAAGHDCLITIDQEGGRVQRLRAPLAREWKPALDHVALASDPVRAMYLRGRLIAAELRAFGIDSNCAPVADVASEGTHPFLRNRCYGSDTASVAARARACALGHLDGGVVPVMKHIPGHGRSTMDSHHDLPHVAASAEVLRAEDFAAFAALKDLPMAMTAHLVYDAFDTRPATLSPVMMQVIREDLGYDGLVMTDDISMKALWKVAEQSEGQLPTAGGSEAPARGGGRELSDLRPDDTVNWSARLARQSLDAGCDVALYCNAPLAERAAVAEAAGQMSVTAQRRAEAALACRKPPAALDFDAAEAELSALMGGQVYG